MKYPKLGAEVWLANVPGKEGGRMIYHARVQDIDYKTGQVVCRITTSFGSIDVKRLPGACYPTRDEALNAFRLFRGLPEIDEGAQSKMEGI